MGDVWEDMTADIIDSIGIPVVYHPLSGGQLNICADFDNESEIVEDESESGRVASQPILRIKSSDVPLAVAGDAVHINQSDYVVVAVTPDDRGETLLFLRVQ